MTSSNIDKGRYHQVSDSQMTILTKLNSDGAGLDEQPIKRKKAK